MRLDRTGHEAMRLVGAATKKTYALTDKTARELTMGITGTEQYRWYWRLGEPNSSLWKLNIVLIGTVVGSIPMAELGEYHLIVLSYA